MIKKFKARFSKKQNDEKDQNIVKKNSENNRKDENDNNDKIKKFDTVENRTRKQFKNMQKKIKLFKIR